MKNFAIVTFPTGKGARRKFLYLNQIRKGFGNPLFEPTAGYVIYSRPKPGMNRAEILVASSLEYELAPIRDLLTAVENLGATVEYF